jgi:hypothetical protein
VVNVIANLFLFIPLFFSLLTKLEKQMIPHNYISNLVNNYYP